MPLTRISQYETTPEAKKVPVWFTLDESQALAVFAVMWSGFEDVLTELQGVGAVERQILQQQPSLVELSRRLRFR